ncbi:MAG: hypothetical protein IJL69_07690 [Oscillospiraceae bacterium]|nr:hypothetical protein [Oscillospiraceae bacterium]
MNLTIRKLTAALLIGAALTGLAACGGEPQESGSTAASTASGAQTTVPSGGESADRTEPSSAQTGFTSVSYATVPLTQRPSSGSQSGSSSDTRATTADTTESAPPPSTDTQRTDAYRIPASLALSVPPPSTDTLGYSESMLFAWYNDAVFVGDSVSLGWRNYVMGKRASQPEYLGRAQFLVSGSLGAESALWDISSESVHPTWQGEQMQLWNSIPLTGAKKVFIMFGLNDVGRYSDLDYGIQMAVRNYRDLTDKIKENAPDVEFTIISATYVLEGGEKGKVTSENLRKLNEALIGFCAEKGYTFLNFADALADEKGNLAAEYCSDGYVHQTNAAYDVWTALLMGYAAGALNGNY